jgi:glucosamine--fructose-6-phosphate aminotransferase (isomerizing)
MRLTSKGRYAVRAILDLTFNSNGRPVRLQEISEHYLSLPEVSWFTLPLLEVIPMQLLAYHVACSLGHDVDQPRNLAKSVTVE